jgi:hypothetical protein
VVDPRLPADQTPVFWLPEVPPTVVSLIATRVPGARRLDVHELGDQISERSGADGQHVIVRFRGSNLRLWIADPGDQPLAVVLPLDDDLPIRVAATLHLWSRVKGGEIEQPLPLTRQQRERLILMARALDGHLADASYREIAEALFGARRIERETWKTSSLRDRTIRLVKGGIDLMLAGYRRLLRGR